MKEFKLESTAKIKPGFTVPEHYFDTVADGVLERVNQKPVVSLYQKRKNYIYAAAAVLVMALMIPFYTNHTAVDEIDDATLENYLAFQSGIGQFELMTVLEPEDIAELNVQMPIADEAIEESLATNPNFEQLITE